MLSIQTILIIIIKHVILKLMKTRVKSIRLGNVKINNIELKYTTYKIDYELKHIARVQILQNQHLIT